jgi:hypothetical protein
VSGYSEINAALARLKKKWLLKHWTQDINGMKNTCPSHDIIRVGINKEGCDGC